MSHAFDPDSEEFKEMALDRLKGIEAEDLEEAFWERMQRERFYAPAAQNGQLILGERLEMVKDAARARQVVKHIIEELDGNYCR